MTPQQKMLLAGGLGLAAAWYWMSSDGTGADIAAPNGGRDLNDLDPRAGAEPWTYAPWADALKGQPAAEHYRAWRDQHRCRLVEKLPGLWVVACDLLPDGVNTTKEAKTAEAMGQLVLVEYHRRFPKEAKAYADLNNELAAAWLAEGTTPTAAPAKGGLDPHILVSAGADDGLRVLDPSSYAPVGSQGTPAPTAPRAHVVHGSRSPVLMWAAGGVLFVGAGVVLSRVFSPPRRR
jgi:hypothetical protein